MDEFGPSFEKIFMFGIGTLVAGLSSVALWVMFSDMQNSIIAGLAACFLLVFTVRLNNLTFVFRGDGFTFGRRFVPFSSVKSLKRFKTAKGEAFGRGFIYRIETDGDTVEVVGGMMADAEGMAARMASSVGQSWQDI